MDWKRVRLVAGILALAALPALAVEIDRKTVKVRFVEYPSVNVGELDFSAVSAEVAWDGFSLGEPELRTTTSICVPEHSDNVLKDAVEITTHYYQVPYEASGGVVVIRDGDGNVIASSRIATLESWERFGYDRCAYVLPQPLDRDYTAALAQFRKKVEAEVTAYFRKRAESALDAALFFNVADEKIPYYTFKDKRYDFGDLEEAATLARATYDTMRTAANGPDDAGRERLERAIDLWTVALEESAPNDKKARINRKATVKLHENIGVARLMLGDADAAKMHFEKSVQLSGMYMTRSDGSGITDLLERAEARSRRSIGNDALRDKTTDLEQLIRDTNHWRNLVPIKVLTQRDVARLQADHVTFSAGAMVQTAEVRKEQREESIASGEVNPYEHLVQRTASQGFILMLTSYHGKLSEFPAEVCELSHLNRLRVENHTFESVPASIGDLSALEVLNLSGNRIRELPGGIGRLSGLKKLDLSDNQLERLPDEIGQLSSLKSLQLKGNPLTPGELERVQQLLPRCKIKS